MKFKELPSLQVDEVIVPVLELELELRRRVTVTINTRHLLVVQIISLFFKKQTRYLHQQLWRIGNGQRSQVHRIGRWI